MTSERGAFNAQPSPGDAVDSEMGPPESTSPSSAAYGSGMSGTTTPATGAGMGAGIGTSGGMSSASDATSGSSGMTDSGSGDHLRDAAGRVAGRMSDTIGQEVDARTGAGFDRAGTMLDHVADAMETAGDKLRPDEAPVADVARAAAGQLRGAADYLRSADMETLLSNAEDFARRQPAIFIGGALAIGLMASRFLKASPPRDSGSSMATPGRFSAGMSSGYRAYGGYRSSTGTSAGSTSTGASAGMSPSSSTLTGAGSDAATSYGAGLGTSGTSTTTSYGSGIGGTAPSGQDGSDDRA